MLKRAFVVVGLLAVFSCLGGSADSLPTNATQTVVWLSPDAVKALQPSAALVWFPVVVGCLGLIFGFLTVVCMAITMSVSFRGTMAQILMRTTERFNDIQKKYIEKRLVDEPTGNWTSDQADGGKGAASEFWSLQWEQYIYYRNGLLPHGLFAYWLQKRRDEHISNRKQNVSEAADVNSGNGSVFHDHIIEVIDGFGNTKFLALMKDVLQDKAPPPNPREGEPPGPGTIKAILVRHDLRWGRWKQFWNFLTRANDDFSDT